MADHTQYGGPSQEWLDHEIAHGPAPDTPIHTLSIEKIQKMVNDGRELASEEAMKAEGHKTRLSNPSSS